MYLRLFNLEELLERTDHLNYVGTKRGVISMGHRVSTEGKPGHTTKKNDTTEQQQLRLIQTVFTFSVIAGVTGVGLWFMGTGISGGLELVIGGTSFFAGHHLGGGQK